MESIKKFIKKYILWAIFLFADYFFFLFISFMSFEPIFSKVGNEVIKRWDKYGAITKKDVAEYESFFNCSITRTSEPYEYIAIGMVILTFILCLIFFRKNGIKNIVLKFIVFVLIHIVMAVLMFVILFGYHWLKSIIC